jgi:SAM-dependent methyltransferase
MGLKVSRETTIIVKFFLDECLPPIIRDSFLYRMFQRAVLGKSAPYFIRFRNYFLKLKPGELERWYRKTEKDTVHSVCDLNAASIAVIRSLIVGRHVLDVACGSGFLSRELGRDEYSVTGVDFVIRKNVLTHPNVTYITANIEALPFKNKQFSTTVSTHTLEHTLNIGTAIDELRRVTNKRLIVVLPKERPYKYGCNLHTYFFPYEYSIFQLFGYLPGKQTLSLVGGDWLYTEQVS